MEIDIVGRAVGEVTCEYAVVLGLTGGAEVRIETRFAISELGQAIRVIDPQNLETDRDLQRVLVGRTVAKATTSAESGSLAVAFDDGTTLRVPPDADFEAWTATWPDGVTLVSLPGGGLSRWAARR